MFLDTFHYPPRSGYKSSRVVVYRDTPPCFRCFRSYFRDVNGRRIAFVIALLRERTRVFYAKVRSIEARRAHFGNSHRCERVHRTLKAKTGAIGKRLYRVRGDARKSDQFIEPSPSISRYR